MNRRSKNFGVAVDDADDTGHHDVAFSPAIKERPILMSAPMVRALLAGTKTQTRRIVKQRGLNFLVGCNQDHGDPTNWGIECDDGSYGWLRLPKLDGLGRKLDPTENWEIPCPYGQPGDRLWVREAFAIVADKYHRLAFRADEGTASACPVDDLEFGRWRPSIHMPRSASRITLEITDVRVERLQEISEEDAIAEGITVGPNQEYAHLATAQYHELWESINGPGSWALNPWVWAITFKRVGA